MKIRLLSIVLLIIGGGVHAQTNESFLLTGRIKNLKEGEKVFLVPCKFSKGEKNDTLCSAIVHNGNFQLQGVVSGPTFFKLLVKGNLPYQLFVENSKMELIGDSLKVANLIGSKSQMEFVTYKKTVAAIEEEMLNMAKTWPKNLPKDQTQQLLKKGDELGTQRTELGCSFAKTHPNSFVSPVIILTTGIYMLNPSVYLPIYNNFSDAVKKSYAAKTIKHRLDKATQVQVGDMAPALSAQTPDGKDLSLADLQKEGKLTLIDFWASWCGPCRKFGAEVVKLYAQHHANGFNVLGVSLDESSDKWKEAIKSDRYTWHNVSDLKGFRSKNSQDYGVLGIPAIFLVDASGKIIAKNPTIEELQKILAQELDTK